MYIAINIVLHTMESPSRRDRIQSICSSGPIVHVSVSTGHHLSYQHILVNLLGGLPSTGAILGQRLWNLCIAPSVVFATLDSDLLGFLIVSLARALQAKPTTALFLRPLQCYSKLPSLRLWLKRKLFQSLCLLPKLTILSIIPYYLCPQLNRVSHAWIHDPQMWDLWLDGRPCLEHTELSLRAEAARRGRQIIIYVGKTSEAKCFSELVELACREKDKVLVVVAGMVDKKHRTMADKLISIGMIVENRYVSDDEVFSLYKIADRAWCRYSPTYDQASGVFGRALQLGVVPIIRDGSLLEMILEYAASTAPDQMAHRDVAILKKACTISPLVPATRFGLP